MKQYKGNSYMYEFLYIKAIYNSLYYDLVKIYDL